MRRRTICAALAVFALGAVGGLVPFQAFGDQMICVPATDFLGRSSLSHATASWQEIVDADALMDANMTAPGTSDTAGGPDRAWLVYRLPVPVDAAEATVAGKDWQIWVHMRVITDQNSFYWQTGPDGETWLPEDVTNANRVNDDAVNFSDSWYWQDQETGNAGAFVPVMSVGTNWLRMGPRETMAEANESPRFDVVCLKNFGPLGADGAPNEGDVLAFIATPVEPKGKLAATWADVKASH